MPKLSIFRLRKIILVIFLLSVTFSLGYVLGESGYKIGVVGTRSITITRDLPPGREDLDFALFWRVWDTLESSYYDKGKLDESEMVYGAIKGMVSAVGDPYTIFLSPSENRIVEEDLQGSFEGVGIQIGFKGSRLTVIAPLPGTPAEEAGIKAGDFIVGIKDERRGIDIGTVGITLPEAVQAIRGPAGTVVTLALVRDENEEILFIDVVRKEIDVPSVVFNYVGDDNSVGHVQLLKFGAESKKEWNDVVKNILKKEDLSGVILDLRNNPGGYLQAAVDIAGDFVENGSTIVIEETADKTRNEYTVESIARLEKVPVVVLINEGSASASEILAGSLRDLRKAKIVGQTSFGKGTIQEPLPVNSGASLHITTSKWLTPKGYWVNEKGIKPDVEIEDDFETSEDEQLTEAIKVLLEGG
jgi:carboxyl-terminal processing protease